MARLLRLRLGTDPPGAILGIHTARRAAHSNEHWVLLGFLGVIRDVSDRKVAENAKAEFVSVVSHELRTPLTSIMGTLSLIQSGTTGTLSDGTLDMLGVAKDNSDRLFRLVNDILDIEKIASDGMEFSMEDIDLSQLATDAVEENRRLSDDLGVTFVVEP